MCKIYNKIKIDIDGFCAVAAILVVARGEKCAVGVGAYAIRPHAGGSHN